MRSSARTTFVALAAWVLLSTTCVTARAAWIPNGNPVRPGSIGLIELPMPVSVAPDEDGGAFVVFGNTIFDSRLNRIQGDGDFAKGWEPDGLAYSRYPQWPYLPTVLADGAHGAFVIAVVQYCEAHCAGNFTELRAQHAASDGRLVDGWTFEGAPIGSGPARPFPDFDDREALAVPNGQGSAIITWAKRPTLERGVEKFELQAQRVNSDGSLPWGAEGVRLRSTAARRFEHAMAPDGAGGVFVVWSDDRSPGIYAQHLSETGRTLWAADGIPLSLLPATVVGRLVATPDGAHGAIVGWAGTCGARAGVFATRINPAGVRTWHTERAVALASAESFDGLCATPTSAGGVVLAWRATQADSSVQIRAQRLDGRGLPMWPATGVTACAATGARDHLVLASDDRDGGYLAWADSRPAAAVFASHLDAAGALAAGWTGDGTPICARQPSSASPNSIHHVPAIAIATVASSSRKGELSPPFTIRTDDRDASARAQLRTREASAMLAWVDDRASQCLSCDFDGLSPYAMMLSPYGPEAAAVNFQSASAHGADPAGSETTIPVSQRLTLRGVAPQRLKLDLVDDSDAKLELFDLAGRKCFRLDLGSWGAGAHDFVLGDANRLANGIYMARLTQGQRVATTRIMIIH